MNSEINSISQQINGYVDQADELIDALKKEDAKTTSKQVFDLLIEYILANIESDSQDAESIKGKLDAVIKKYSTDIENANNLETSLNAAKNNPEDQTASEVSYLQNLISVLTGDLKSGNMNDL